MMKDILTRLSNMDRIIRFHTLRGIPTWDFTKMSRFQFTYVPLKSFEVHISEIVLNLSACCFYEKLRNVEALYYGC
jgi:hypothetical protein